MKKLLTAIVCVFLLTVLLTACGGGAPASVPAEEPKEETAAPEEEASAAAETEEEEENTGDASLDDPLNQDGIGEKELLVVSFGTSYNDSRRLTIGAIEKALQAAYPDWSVRRAFTSQIIIDKLKEKAVT